jgi:sodium-coupled neutral amino acid transporter 11
MVAYLIIIKDTVPVALGLTNEAGGGSFMETDIVMIVTSLVTLLPLSLQRDMANLSFTSFSSVLADVFLVLLVTIYSPIPTNIGDIIKIIFENAINDRIFIGLGVLSTAMACQHSCFIVAGSLEDRTPERWSRVTFRSIALAWFLCTLMGVTGYLGFEEETKGDILNNFDE